MELFFDLVYVLAVTQLSRLLQDHLTMHGALQTALLLLAVWWGRRHLGHLVAAGLATAGLRALYLTALLAAAMSMACLIAPVSQHRILFGQRRKPRLVQSGHRFAHAGLAFLLVAVIVSLFLIVDVVANVGAAIGLCTAVGAWFVVAWYVMPLRERQRRR